MKYSGHRKLLRELSKLSNLMLLTSSDTKWTLMHLFLFTNSAQKETGFNMYAEYTRPQLTFLALHPWLTESAQIPHLRHLELLVNYMGDQYNFWMAWHKSLDCICLEVWYMYMFNCELKNLFIFLRNFFI